MEKADKKELRRQFLEEEQLKKLDAGVAARKCCGDALREFDEQSHEAWLLQCPKGTDPRQLAGKRIKLPGKKRVGDLRVRAVSYSAPQSETLGYVSGKGKYSLRKLPLAGYVVVSKRRNAKQTDEGQEEQVYPATAVPPKFVFRERHPLFGRDYKQRIELPKEIAKSLSQADKKNLETKARLSRTDNYYKIRSTLMTTTQTLAQKEHDVRQSVLTGFAPKFMNSKPTYEAYQEQSDAEDVKDSIVLDSAEEAGPTKKHKKSKTNGHKLVEIKEEEEEESIAPKKRKKHKSNGEIPDDVVEVVEEEEVTERKKQKKRKSNGQVLGNETTEEVIAPKKHKKSKLIPVNGNNLEEDKDLVTIVIEDNDVEGPPRKRKKLKAVE
ncbi:uncharacterized protein [Drosophila takahashii]|uniref:uncharacterized protein n=1 Tax=Drosophila takahashii TaxID=29030 RepID=UPI001CF818F0|nr:transcriptional regulator ATRX homolog [Drosophila takahashii]